MRTRALISISIVALVASALAACVPLKRTPEARYFVLRALATVQGDMGDLAQGGVVGVLPVRLPGYAERPQVVEWIAPNEIRVNEFVRWAEPLEAGTSRALTDDLAILLPHHRILAYPWQGGGDMSCRVGVEVRTFGLQPDGRVRFDGRWALLPPSGDSPLTRADFSYERGPLSEAAAARSDAAVEAMSELLADLAGELARAIQALPYTSRELSVTEAPETR
jgi:uncharacterized lipoprotein YmbA